MLAGIMEPDGGADIPEMNVSYKPQKISPKFEVPISLFNPWNEF